MSGRMDGVTLSMSRAILDAQEVQAAAQRLTQLVELQQRETLRVETEHRLRQTRALWRGGASRGTASGRPVEAAEERTHGEDAPPRPYVPARTGGRRGPDAPPDSLPPLGLAMTHPSLGTRLDVRA